jgi:hypothetical protein
MASGNGGQIALARIASLYVEVNTADVWTNFVSETLEHRLNELEEGSITGRRDAPPSHKGIDMGDGDINFEPNPNALAFMVQGFFGTRTSSLITDAASTGANSGAEAGKAQWYHEFTPRQASFSERTFLEPHNVMVYRDVGSAFLFQGAIFPTLNIDIEAGQLTKSSISLMARTVNRMARGDAASLTRVGGRPWVWDMASVEVSTDTSSDNLVANTNFERLSFSFNLPHEGVALLDGTKKYSEFTPNDFRRVNIEGTMSFRSHAEYEAFKAYEQRRLRVTLLNVNSNLALGNVASLDPANFLGYFGMRIHLPAMKYLRWNAPIGGPNRLTASFTAKAEFDDVSGIMAQIDMMNNISAGSLHYSHGSAAWQTVVTSPIDGIGEDAIVTGGGEIHFYVNTGDGEQFNSAINSATMIAFLRGVGNAQISAAMTVAAFSLEAANHVTVTLPAVGAFSGVGADTHIPWTVPTSMFTNRPSDYTVASAFIITNSV